jgi:hypothetical protein
MVYLFKTPLPKAGQSVGFASSRAKSSRWLIGPTNLKSTVGQYSRTDHTNCRPVLDWSTVRCTYSAYHHVFEAYIADENSLNLVGYNEGTSTGRYLHANSNPGTICTWVPGVSYPFSRRASKTGYSEFIHAHYARHKRLIRLD